MKIAKIVLVIFTAIFMAFHTQIFIRHIEPNLFFSWLAAGLIEGFLITLAVSKRTLIRYVLLAFLYLISVISASASFLVKNENLLEDFFTHKRVIEQLQLDIQETKKAYQFGEKYVTKTLARERALSDEMRELLKQQKGYLPLVQALVFFVFCLALQTASIYTATTLKQVSETFVKHPSKQQTETAKLNFETGHEPPPETVRETPTETDSETLIETEQVRRLREQGKSYREIAKEIGIPVSRVYRLMKG